MLAHNGGDVGALEPVFLFYYKNVADMDGDGRPDVVVACRTGLYVFLDKGYSTRSRDKSPLPDRDIARAT